MRNPTRDVILSDEQLDLVIEGLHMLRLYQNGITDTEGQLKLREVERLEDRLCQRRWKRRQGHTGNYAEKL